MHKAFKYKLHPTKEQIHQLEQVAGATRFVWNYMLEQNISSYKETKKFLFKYDMISLLPELKKENQWLKNSHSAPLQQKCIDLDSAIRRTFKSNKKRTEFPKFKSKKHNNDSFKIPQIIANGKDPHIKPRKKKIKIPKLGWVKWNKHRNLQGRLTNITIKKENEYWWCICVCEISDVETKPVTSKDELVGIDLGIKEFAITNDGEVFSSQNFYRKKKKRLKHLSKKYSKKKRGSKNQEKARKKLNKLHYNIKNQRKYFTNKTSRQIINDYLFVAVEDLNIKNMTKNRHLSKSINDQGWAMFVNQLIYKSKANGGGLVKINRFAPSSKTCSCCGNTKDIPLKERIYKCSSCFLEIDRDLNAAINIKAFALKDIGDNRTEFKLVEIPLMEEVAYDTSSYVSMKQEKS